MRRGGCNDRRPHERNSNPSGIARHSDRDRTTANDSKRRRSSKLRLHSMAWVGKPRRGTSTPYECLPRCHVCARCLPMVYVSVAHSAATVTSSPRVLVIVKPLLNVPHGWLCCLLCHCAAGLVGWVCGCVRLVRTARKSLARVLTPSALDLSLCLLQCMLRCRLCACCSLPSLCVWALLRAPPPIGLKCCVSVCCDQGGAIFVGSNGRHADDVYRAEGCGDFFHEFCFSLHLQECYLC